VVVRRVLQRFRQPFVAALCISLFASVSLRNITTRRCAAFLRARFYSSVPTKMLCVHLFVSALLDNNTSRSCSALVRSLPFSRAMLAAVCLVVFLSPLPCAAPADGGAAVPFFTTTAKARCAQWCSSPHPLPCQRAAHTVTATRRAEGGDPNPEGGRKRAPLPSRRPCCDRDAKGQEKEMKHGGEAGQRRCRAGATSGGFTSLSSMPAR
jgi:hypothetical protein